MSTLQEMAEVVKCNFSLFNMPALINSVKFKFYQLQNEFYSGTRICYLSKWRIIFLEAKITQPQCKISLDNFCIFTASANKANSVWLQVSFNCISCIKAIASENSQANIISPGSGFTTRNCVALFFKYLLRTSPLTAFKKSITYH